MDNLFASCGRNVLKTENFAYPKRIIHYRFFPLISLICFLSSISCEACESFISRFEKQHGIPEKLLSAIALIESGRRLDGQKVAWPWTINANGIPYIFDTKQEAVTKVKEFQLKGIHSIDVGCMQINLLHHPHAFKSIEAAFDPETNIAYAASFLKEKMKAQGDWHHAVAHYHSATKTLNEPYKKKVLQTWSQIQAEPGLLSTILTLPIPPTIVKVPLVGLGQRTVSINVRFHPFTPQKLKKPQQLGAGQITMPGIHSLKTSIRGNFKSSVSVKERRIPLDVFVQTPASKYSLHRSAHFPS